MGKQISCLKRLNWKLHDKLGMNIKEGAIAEDSILVKEPLNHSLKFAHNTLTPFAFGDDDGSGVSRALPMSWSFCGGRNPLLIGTSVLDNLMYVKEIGCISVHCTSRFRSFFHLYSALIQFGLTPIPFLNHIMEIYHEVIFVASFRV